MNYLVECNYKIWRDYHALFIRDKCVCSQLPNYLEKDWSCKGEIVANPPEFAVWSFESFDSAQKVILDLGMNTSYKYGSIIMALYCPFWMLNKTGLMLSYRVCSRCSHLLLATLWTNCNLNISIFEILKTFFWNF